MEIKTDLFFQVGSLQSFKYFFKYEDNDCEEVIYGIILEHLDFVNKELQTVKIGQIVNLEGFLKLYETTTRERIFKISELHPNPQFLNSL